MAQQAKSAPVSAAIIAANTSEEATKQAASYADHAARFGQAYVDACAAGDAGDRSKLALIVTALETVPQVTATIWRDTVAAPIERALFNSYPEAVRTEKETRRRVAARLSQVKPVVFALTNPKGLRPTEGETFTAFRERCTAGGNEAASKGGNTSRGEDRKGGKRGEEVTLNAGQHMDAACLLIAHGDAKVAASLSLCLGDMDTRERLYAWINKAGAVLAD
jgi:hypothetical protein